MIGLVVFGAMYVFGIVGNTTHHFACGAENLGQKNREAFFVEDGNYFTSGDAQSSDFVKEGKYSLKLTGANQYGFGMDYEYLVGNEEVTAWVWRFAEGDWKNAGKIVASISGKLWKAAEEVVETDENGWEKIQFVFQIPNNCANEIFNIYCWNPTSETIYFDDFHVVIREQEEL